MTSSAYSASAAGEDCLRRLKASLSDGVDRTVDFHSSRQVVAQTIPHCVNHKGVETRLACSSCESPICTRCVRPAAVGQKCPACARQPRTALAMGKPKHYLVGGGAGLVVAVAGGLLLAMARSGFGYGTVILPALLGFGVGTVVRWGAQHQTHRNFQILAAVLGVLGGLLAGGLISAGLVAILNRPFALLGAAAAGYFAVRGLVR